MRMGRALCVLVLMAVRRERSTERRGVLRVCRADFISDLWERGLVGGLKGLGGGGGSGVYRRRVRRGLVAVLLGVVVVVLERRHWGHGRVRSGR